MRLSEEDYGVVEEARAILGDSAGQFFDLAPSSSLENWRNWTSKYAGMDCKQADALYAVLCRMKIQENYEHAVEQRDRCVAQALNGQPKAACCDRGQELFNLAAEQAPYTEIPSWFQVQDDAPGLVDAAQQVWAWAELLPLVRYFLDTRYIRGVSRSTRLRSGASWDGKAHKPAQRIAIGSDWWGEALAPSSTILHEIGHAVQEWGSDNGFLADNWYLQPHWFDGDAPTASADGARRGAFEAFAEDFVEIAAGDPVGFSIWAPEQCRDLENVLFGLLLGLQNVKRNPRKRQM